MGTGLLWAPCAGPILGLILTGAALNGASVGTSLLLLAYAAGACTSLAAALLFGGRAVRGDEAFAPHRRMGPARARARRCWWASAPSRWAWTPACSARLSVGTTSALEQALVEKIGMPQASSRRASTTSAALEATRPDADGRRRRAGTRAHARRRGRFPSLAGATEWINSPPLTPEGLRGKVVLVDFWTYSCINCLRTLPYVRAWAEKYKDAGLVVIGVHAPEFAFEKRRPTCAGPTKDLGIDFPVALDNDFAIWRALRQPALARVLFHRCAGPHPPSPVRRGPVRRSPSRSSSSCWPRPGKRNVPLGRGRAAGRGHAGRAGHRARACRARPIWATSARSNFASPGGIASDRAHTYQAAASLRTNQWALAGEWTVERERAVLNRANGRIAYRFQARDLHLVLGPAADGKPVRFRVLVDGKPPLADHGSDIDAQGNGMIDAQRLYQLVRQAATRQGPPVRDRIPRCRRAGLRVHLRLTARGL